MPEREWAWSRLEELCFRVRGQLDVSYPASCRNTVCHSPKLYVQEVGWLVVFCLSLLSTYKEEDME